MLDCVTWLRSSYSRSLLWFETYCRWARSVFSFQWNKVKAQIGSISILSVGVLNLILYHSSPESTTPPLVILAH